MRQVPIMGLCVMIFLAGCGNLATPHYEATLVLRDAQTNATAIVAQAQTEIASQPTNTQIATATFEPTTLPTVMPTATVEITDSNDIAVQVAAADTAHGEELFNTFQAAASFACATCHHVVSDDRLIGPGLLTISTRASTRVDGLSVEAYIYESIVEPSAYVVAEYPDLLMPPNWAEIYSDDDIYDIIAYLLTLN